MLTRVTAYDIGNAFRVFDTQGSGCLSYGVMVDGRRWFVKRPTTAATAQSLTRAVAVHAAVRHDTIVAPARILTEEAGNPVLIYPWWDGTVLNHATRHGSDRAGLTR